MDHEKLLPPPFIDTPQRAWIRPKPKALGEWHAWEAAGIRGWTLKCLPVFQAEVRHHPHNVPKKNGKAYSLDINGVEIGWHDDLATIQHCAELAMVSRIRAMMPAYLVIEARAEQRIGG
jgi:hypothetical protein